MVREGDGGDKREREGERCKEAKIAHFAVLLSQRMLTFCTFYTHVCMCVCVYLHVQYMCVCIAHLYMCIEGVCLSYMYMLTDFKV